MHDSKEMAMTTPILYYWGPCATCALVTAYADEHGIELDCRDVEQEGPYQELLALGGDANQIPYLCVEGELIQGVDAINAYLAEHLA